ncbi:MAG: hypothetical protein HY756_01050 [Nitrospirae bacterium]|nr:hypothetical protein [Nitrospirota bacterium]
MKKMLLIWVVMAAFLTGTSYAGNLHLGLHSGYGVVKFKERENYLGANMDSDSKQNMALFGVSGEYSLSRNFFLGAVTDWIFGMEEEEKWRQNSVQIQTDDMRFSGQFYDFRVGYKDNIDNFYYRTYLTGGWDGMRFKRRNVIFNGNPAPESIEEVSLWRTGVGIGLGYKMDKWAIDGRAAYSYYPDGETEDSGLPQYTFDTKGTCLDIGLGMMREITQNTKIYFGGSYTLQRLKSDNVPNISWRTELEIIAGVVSLMYAF